jgi:hypothetical protein
MVKYITLIFVTFFLAKTITAKNDIKIELKGFGAVASEDISLTLLAAGSSYHLKRINDTSFVLSLASDTSREHGQNNFLLVEIQNRRYLMNLGSYSKNIKEICLYSKRIGHFKVRKSFLGIKYKRGLASFLITYRNSAENNTGILYRVVS